MRMRKLKSNSGNVNESKSVEQGCNVVTKYFGFKNFASYIFI